MSKIALIAGGSQEIGRQTACSLAQADEDVGVNYRRSAAAATASLAEPREQATKAVALPGDIAVEPDWLARLANSIAMRRGGHATEVADTSVALASQRVTLMELLSMSQVGVKTCRKKSKLLAVKNGVHFQSWAFLQ